MNKKQLAILFVCNGGFWITGNYVFSLMPIYATRLGADSASTGNFLALSFVALTIGTIGAGWLSNRFGRQKLFIVGGGLVNCACTWAMGQVTQFWMLIPATIGAWLCGGMVISMTTIMAGSLTAESERGKIFGLLGVNLGIGQLIGGALSGPVVDHWGFAVLFSTAAIGNLITALIALPLQDIAPTPSAGNSEKHNPPARVRLGSTFYILLAAAIISSVPLFIVNLGRPLWMDQLGYDASQISGVVAIGGAISLPFPLILGWLSDRIGRYRLIALCYLMTMSSLAIMVFATQLWQFWLSNILLAIGGAATVVGLALTSQLVPPEGLSAALAQYGANGWIGGIIGLAGTGYALKLLGVSTTFALGVILAFFAVILLIAVRSIHNRQSSAVVSVS